MSNNAAPKINHSASANAVHQRCWLDTNEAVKKFFMNTDNADVIARAKVNEIIGLVSADCPKGASEKMIAAAIHMQLNTWRDSKFEAAKKAVADYLVDHPDAIEQNAYDVVQKILDLRKEKGLPQIAHQALLKCACEAGIEVKSREMVERPASITVPPHPSVRAPGKTARERESGKIARHNQNRASAAENNRLRSLGGGSGKGNKGK